MPEPKPIFGELRPWIAAALGAGLVVAGVAIALGMSSLYGPFLGVVVTVVILTVVHLRMRSGQRNG